MSKLTHVNNKGEANMVDVSDKDNTVRTAKASAKVGGQAVLGRQSFCTTPAKN